MIDKCVRCGLRRAEHVKKSHFEFESACDKFVLGHTTKEWADLLVDNVATVTQPDPEKGQFANVEDWRRNAEKLFELALEQGYWEGWDT